jgi:exodeoxyribonuclease VII small subunit
MSDPGAAQSEELSFGEGLAKLDQIVASLEGGQLELEESMKRYESGVALLKALQAKLAHAQQKVTMLIGELEEEAGVAKDASADAGTTTVNLSSEEVPF